MSKNLTKKDLPRFYEINKYNVAIKSLRNQLKQAVGIDELTNIAAKIIDLEHQIMIEKTNGYKQLEEEKKLIEKRIDTLTRELAKAKNELTRIGNSLDFKLHGYKKKLQDRIESLNDEYCTMVEYIDLAREQGTSSSAYSSASSSRFEEKSDTVTSLSNTDTLNAADETDNSNTTDTLSTLNTADETDNSNTTDTLSTLNTIDETNETSIASTLNTIDEADT